MVNSPFFSGSFLSFDKSYFFCPHKCYISLVAFIPRRFCWCYEWNSFFQLYFLIAFGWHIGKLLLFICDFIPVPPEALLLVN